MPKKSSPALGALHQLQVACPKRALAREGYLCDISAMARAGFLRRVLRAIGREIGEGAFSSAAAVRLFQQHSQEISRNFIAPTGVKPQPSSYPVPTAELVKMIGSPLPFSPDAWRRAVDDTWKAVTEMLGTEPSPEWCVLEPGCGCGRLAISVAPMVRSYIGFDVNPVLIDWCRENIPQGEFHHVDAKNEQFNVSGIEPIRFPCKDGDANLIYMASVVTHLRRGDLEEFLRESMRCMKPGGVLFFSCYLQSSAVDGRDTVPVGEFFTKPVSHILDEVSWVDDPASNTFIVYDEDWVLRFATSLGFHHERTVRGSWGGAETDYNTRIYYGQDWLHFRKP